MWVPANDLSRESLLNIRKVKCAALRCKLRMENYLQQHVAELFGHRRIRLLTGARRMRLYCVMQLPRLFNEVLGKG